MKVKFIILLFIPIFLFSQKSLEEEFIKEKRSREYIIKKDYPLLRIHRITGYSAFTFSVINSVLGVITLYRFYRRGVPPPDGLKYTHRYLGYLTLSLYSFNTLTGIYNYIRLKKQKKGRRKRIVHMTLSIIATSLMGYGVYMSYSARTAPNFNLYYTHRNLMLISVGTTLLTIGTIVW